VSDVPAARLSRAEITALTYAARRQLTRWARRTDLRPREHEQRATLIRAVRTLEDPALAGGCELRASGGG